jgi:hypothetical protein
LSSYAGIITAWHALTKSICSTAAGHATVHVTNAQNGSLQTNGARRVFFKYTPPAGLIVAAASAFRLPLLQLLSIVRSAFCGPTLRQSSVQLISQKWATLRCQLRSNLVGAPRHQAYSRLKRSASPLLCCLTSQVDALNLWGSPYIQEEGTCAEPQA